MVSNMMRRVGLAVTAAAVLAIGLAAPGLSGTPTQAAAAVQTPPAHSGLKLPAGVRYACPPPTTPGVMTCTALLRTQAPARASASAGPAATAPAGYGPPDLQSAYGVQGASEGTRQTVAIVVPYDDATAEADLAVYRSQYGLPPCTTADGCFTKVDLSGAPTNNAGWAATAQVSMDVVSAVCPNCHIMLVEAVADDMSDLGAAVQTAASDGAQVVDFTGTTAEFSGETSDDVYFDQPGVAIVAGAGDTGYPGVSYPAASPYVTAVGGTVLTADSSTARGWTETAWPDTGSGCSSYEPEPSWQDSVDTQCTGRMDNDVSAVAASASSETPVAYYDSYDEDGWGQAGGTVVSASVVSAIYAMGGQIASGSNPASYPYSHPDMLNAVTSGSNGTCTVTSWCTAGAGYNGPGGLGTPGSVAPFTSTGTLSGAIWNGSLDECLENPNNSTTNGNKVEISSCDGDADQQWTVESDYKIETGNGMCLGADGGGDAAVGAAVWVWVCPAGLSWQPNYPQRLSPERAGICLGVSGTTSGSETEISSCGTAASQQWTLPYPVPTSTGEIMPQSDTAECIGLTGDNSTNPTGLYGCDGDTNQTWTVEANGSIKSANGKCLDVHDSGTANGTEVDYAGCGGDGAQQWLIESDGSLLNPESGRCLASASSSLVLEACTYTAAQEWVLPAVS